MFAVAAVLLSSACASWPSVAAAGPGRPEPGLGTALYTASDAAATRKWTDGERTELRCRESVGRLVPGRVPDDARLFLAYFRLIENRAADIRSAVGRKRAALAVADAIGAYLHAKMLPAARARYYDGALDYPTAKRLHDLMAKIKYILNTDGRGWARPTAADRGPAGGRDKTASWSAPRPDERCGGVDAAPYGLRRRRRWPTDDDDDDGSAGVDVPFFDNDTRPHSLVVPWRPGRPVLFGVHDAGCHRALFDHCARTAAALSGRNVRALREWLNAIALPLIAASETAGRWYPALWGARLAARQLDETVAAAAATAAADDYRDYYFDGSADVARTVPNGNFYATVVLASASVCWTAALCALFREWCVGCACWLVDYAVLVN